MSAVEDGPVVEPLEEEHEDPAPASPDDDDEAGTELIEAPARFGESGVPVPAPPPPPLVVRELRVPANLDPRLILLREPASERAAAFRLLRRRVAGAGDPRALLVTSVSPGDGKTTCAVNLALAMAEACAEDILLVDANLYAPSLAPLFGLGEEQSRCFVRQMARHRSHPDEPWEVFATAGGNLHVLAARSGQYGEAVDAPVFARAVRELGVHYRSIVVDGPPISGAGAQVNLLQDAVDALLLAVRPGQSAHLLEAAVERLAPANIIAAVLIPEI